MFKNIICLIILSSTLVAQEIRVIEILDANLFRTKDSTLISMVNLEVPSISDEDSGRVEFAKKAMELAKLYLLRQKLRFQETYKNRCIDSNVRKGHLWRVYPLSDKSINELYLEKGYAVYVPCDTLYMSEYGKAAMESMNKSLGIWQPVKISDKLDMFNRFRLSVILYQGFLEKDLVFPPLFGLNYRWSDVFTMIEYNKFSLNASVETGTLLYFVLPYMNFGTEARIKNFYLRGHYDVLLPFFFVFDADDIDAFNFWGLDAGIIVPFGRKGIEIEYNIKSKDGFFVNYFSLSFAVY